MKSAYELAMERLNKQAPQVKLTAEQKKQMAELDSIYAAKIAEREINFQSRIAEAESSGDWETMEKARQELARDRKRFQAELEEKKEQVRQPK